MIRARQYKEGEKNFRKKNLRGLSFKGENLSGADFSGADIRGTNFQGANLTGTKFCGAKGGLQKRWVMVLLIVVFILAGISGLFSALTGYLISLIFDNSSLEFQVLGWATLIVAIFFWIVVISRGIIAAFGAFAITVAFAGAIAVAFAGAIPVPVAGAITYAGAIAVVGAIAVPIPVAFAVPVAGAIAVPVPVAFAVPVAGAIAVPVPVAIPGAVVTTFLSAYVAYRAIKGDEKHALIRNLAIAFAATGGTCFREADLTDADFSQATLKSTDFRKATLTRTCFRDTKKLDRVRPEKTYLQEAKVRELVKTGQGQDKNFDRLDLRGINLKEANLQDASFIATDLNRANLQNANLSRARLVQTLLEGADLTRATLTGACVEDWGISNTTKLIEIDCNYIFLKSPEHERRPADPEKYFEPGEFAKLAQKIPHTVDLVFKDGIDWQTFLKTFQELRVESDTEELPVIQTIENKGDGAFVIRVKVSDKIDEAEYERKFWEKYKPKLKAKNKEIKLLNQQIKNIRKDNTKLIGVVETMAEKQDSKYDLRGAKFGGGFAGKDQKFGGGFAGKDQKFGGGFAGRDQIGGTFNDYSTNPEAKQNLAETAQEIQELLQQLEESNPTETTENQMTVADQAVKIVENNPTLKQRVIGVLKSAGTEAFKEALDNPVANVLVAAFQGWVEP